MPVEAFLVSMSLLLRRNSPWHLDADRHGHRPAICLSLAPSQCFYLQIISINLYNEYICLRAVLECPDTSGTATKSRSSCLRISSQQWSPSSKGFPLIPDWATSNSASGLGRKLVLLPSNSTFLIKIIYNFVTHFSVRHEPLQLQPQYRTADFGIFWKFLQNWLSFAKARPCCYPRF